MPDEYFDRLEKPGPDGISKGLISEGKLSDNTTNSVIGQAYAEQQQAIAQALNTQSPATLPNQVVSTPSVATGKSEEE